MKAAWVAALAIAAAVVWLCWPQRIDKPRSLPITPAAVAEPSAAAAANGQQRLELAVPIAVPADPGLAGVPLWTASIRVLDQDDEPVEDAIVEVFAGRCCAQPTANGPQRVWLGRAEAAPLLTLRTDADGDCPLSCERERVYVRARHADFGCSIEQAVEAPPPGRTRDVRLWLARPVLVRGIVIDAAAAPVPFATLDVQLDETRGGFGVAREHCLPSAAIRCDANGRCCWEASFGTPFKVQAKANGDKSLIAHAIATEGVEVVVAFDGALAIRGRVVDADHRPIAHAAVRLRNSTAQAVPTRPGDEFCADADGTFVRGVGDTGNYFVEANAPGDGAAQGATGQVVVSMQDRQPLLELQLPALRPIRGRVVLPNGEAAGEAVVAACPAVADTVAAVPCRGRSKVDGSFVLQVPAQRSWTLQAETSTGFGRCKAIDSGASDVVITLQPRPQLTGSVVRDRDGAPVEGFELVWISTSLWRGHRVCSMSGADLLQRDGARFACSLAGADGRYLVATAPDRCLAPAAVGPIVLGEGPLDVVLRLPDFAVLGVRVVDHTGRPLRHLQLYADLTLSTSWLMVQPASRCTTDADGRGSLTLAPGTGAVVVRRSFEELARREVDVVSGANAELVITVQR